MSFRGLGVVVVIVVASCTQPNPRSCLDGTCTDPAFPFCDVNGTLGGIVGECITVTCAPGEFAECRDDVAVSCNAEGTSYDLSRCERVCDQINNGCRLCDPNETACTNGIYATCDGEGNVSASSPCPLGCFDTQRCRELVASNELDAYREMLLNPVDLDLSGSVTIDTATGAINGVSAIVSFLKPAPPDGAAIRVFVARNVRMGNVTVRGGTVGLQPALAIVATGEITVEGTLMFSTETPCAGGVDDVLPAGMAPVGGVIPSPQQILGTGGGGAGFGTAGADGGDINDTPAVCPHPAPAGTCAGGAGGAIAGTESLVPLRGGSGNYRVSGGGALQLSSAQLIRVTGTIDIRGSGGVVTLEQDPVGSGLMVFIIGGGSSGGGVLLEAPRVELASQARILATGGSGASRTTNGTVASDGSVAFGAPCSLFNCGQGGAAAAVGVPATEGASVSAATTPPNSTAGGGGGGLGRIRINTADGTYTKGANVIEAGVLTTGVIQTR